MKQRHKVSLKRIRSSSVEGEEEVKAPPSSIHPNRLQLASVRCDYFDRKQQQECKSVKKGGQRKTKRRRRRRS